MIAKAWGGVVTAWDVYLEIIESLGAAGNGTVWPVLILATWWFL